MHERWPRSHGTSIGRNALAGGEGKKRTRRSYRPTVEVMEALRLLSGAATASLPGVVVEHNVLADHGTGARPLVSALPSISGDTWDAALLHTQLADLLSSPGLALVSSPAGASTSDAAVSSGLAQLNKYLSRAWYRAGIPRRCTKTAHRRSTPRCFSNLAATSSTP